MARREITPFPSRCFGQACQTLNPAQPWAYCRDADDSLVQMRRYRDAPHARLDVPEAALHLSLIHI